MVNRVEEQHPHQTGDQRLREEVSTGQELRRLPITRPIIQCREFPPERLLNFAAQFDRLLHARERHLHPVSDDAVVGKFYEVLLMPDQMAQKFLR